jgi:hypothetical protein
LRLFLIQVNLLKSKFGFDEAFNYKKEQDLDAALRRLASQLFFCALYTSSASASPEIGGY